MKNLLVKKAVLPCAGKGTRMAPITEILPKELLPLNCKPTIWYILTECLEGGIEEVCVITSKSKPLIEQYVTKEFGDKLKLTFVYQEVMNGTAKAVYLAKDFVGESSFLYANPDCLFSSFLPTKELIKKSEGQNVLSVFHGTEEELSKFSVDEFVSQPPERGKLNKISRILEKPTAEETTSRYMGYWRAVFTSEIFSLLEQVVPSKNGEYQLTDAIESFAKQGKLFGLLSPENEILFDAGAKLGYAEANLYFTKNPIK